MIAALLLVPVLAYAGLCTLMYFQQRGLLYYGGYTRVDAAGTDFALTRPDGAVLRGWTVNAGAADALLYFGGNAESVQGMREPLAQWLPGRASSMLAYRGYGASDGAPAQDLLFADALALYDDVAAKHPGARIAVAGRSLGSGVAAYVAAHRPVDRLVLITPYDSMVAVAASHYPWLPANLLVTERYESAHWLRDYRGPVFILRAGRDTVIPPANTDALIAALPRPPQVLAVPEADHNSILSTRAEADALIAFLQP